MSDGSSIAGIFGGLTRERIGKELQRSGLNRINH